MRRAAAPLGHLAGACEVQDLLQRAFAVASRYICMARHEVDAAAHVRRRTQSQDGGAGLAREIHLSLGDLGDGDFGVACNRNAVVAHNDIHFALRIGVLAVVHRVRPAAQQCLACRLLRTSREPQCGYGRSYDDQLSHG